MFLLYNLGSRLIAQRDYLKAKLHREEDGVTAMEYGLIAALIAIVIIVALTLAGGALNDIFTQIACALRGDDFTFQTAGTAGDASCTAA